MNDHDDRLLDVFLEDMFRRPQHHARGVERLVRRGERRRGSGRARESGRRRRVLVTFVTVQIVVVAAIIVILNFIPSRRREDVPVRAGDAPEAQAESQQRRVDAQELVEQPGQEEQELVVPDPEPGSVRLLAPGKSYETPCGHKLEALRLVVFTVDSGRVRFLSGWMRVTVRDHGSLRIDTVAGGIDIAAGSKAELVLGSRTKTPPERAREKARSRDATSWNRYYSHLDQVRVEIEVGRMTIRNTRGRLSLEGRAAADLVPDEAPRRVTPGSKR